jgi:carbonic anhydrase
MKRDRSHTRIAAGIGFATALFVFAGCGGDTTTSTSPAAETTENPEAGDAAANSAATATTVPAPAHWTYDGEDGPENWGELDPAYALCADGSSQTPIDVTGAVGVDLTNPIINYTAGDAVVVNNGHTVQLQAAEGNSITVDDKAAPLAQIHFHTPSEHTIDGQTFEAEVHFVHITEASEITVLGVMITSGQRDNAAWQPYIDSLGTAEGSDAATQIDWAAMLPPNLATYRYGGSLTTPPCTEGVDWLLLETPVELSATQIEAFVAAYDGNARPVQPLNERTLEMDSTADR